MAQLEALPTAAHDVSHESDGAVVWTERALGAALIVGTVAVVVLSRGADVAARLSTWPWSGWWHALLMMPPVAFIIGAAARRPVPRLGAALDIGLFLWAFSAVVGAWFAVVRPLAMNAASLPFATICLAYVVRGWLGFDPVVSRRRAHHVLVVVGLATAAVLATAWWLPGPALPGREHAGVGLAAIALPVFVGLALSVRGVWRLTWLVAAGSATGFVVLVGKLAGHCALIAIVLSAGLALITTRRAVRLGWIAMIVGALGLTILGLVAWLPNWPSSDAVARERTAMLKAGLAMGADRPWLGHGPGMVAQVFSKYGDEYSIEAHDVTALSSTPVQVWAEHGSIGMFAMILLTIGVGLRAWRLRPGGVAAEAGSTEDRLRAWSVVCSMAAGAGFACAEFPLDAPPLLAVLAALLPVLSALTRPIGDARVAWSPTFVRVTPALAVLAAAAVIAWHVWPNVWAGRHVSGPNGHAGKAAVRPVMR
jgi:hypothetical protein